MNEQKEKHEYRLIYKLCAKGDKNGWGDIDLMKKKATSGAEAVAECLKALQKLGHGRSMGVHIEGKPTQPRAGYDSAYYIGPVFDPEPVKAPAVVEEAKKAA